MRTKSLSLTLTLTLMLTTAAMAAPRTHTMQPKTPDGPSDVTVIERVVRAVKKIVHTFDLPTVPVPGTPTTTT